jgi:hypothetical protein
VAGLQRGEPGARRGLNVGGAQRGRAVGVAVPDGGDEGTQLLGACLRPPRLTE